MHIALRSIMIAKIAKIINNAQTNCKKCKNIWQNAIIIAKIFVKAQKCLMMIHTILLLLVWGLGLKWLTCRWPLTMAEATDGIVLPCGCSKTAIIDEHWVEPTLIYTLCFIFVNFVMFLSDQVQFQFRICALDTNDKAFHL